MYGPSNPVVPILILNLQSFNQLPNLTPDIWTPHQRLSHENGVDPRFSEFQNILVCIDATFADDNLIGWDGRSQTESGLDVRVEGSQVSVIDANDFCACFQRKLQFFFGMDLDEACEVKASRNFNELTQLSQRQDRDDEQDGVGPCNSRLINVIRVNGEVLPQ